MWTNEMGPWLSNTLASDGFMLNLGAVLLLFCKPFSEGIGNAKMLKIGETFLSKRYQFQSEVQCYRCFG